MAKTFTEHRPKPKAGKPAPSQSPARAQAQPQPAKKPQEKPKEIGGPEGPEPTRYGDWERKGICVDF